MSVLVRDVLLLDGSTLRLTAPTPADLDDIRSFYDGLSPESRYMRFHGYGRTELAARALAESSGEERLALIGRHAGAVVAATQYEQLREPGAAEVAFAVADDFQGRGTATRMLEQLAEIGAARGLHRFDAYVLPHNRAMLRVFERAGFAVRRSGGFDELTVSLDIAASEEVRARIDERDHLASVRSLRPILAPASIAVLGEGEVARALRDSIAGGGFRGELLELGDGPELVILAGAPPELAEAAAGAAAAGAKALLALTPIGPRDQRVLETVRQGGLRLVGPSSLGVLNTDPGVRLDATVARASVAPGRLAICSQSGAVGVGLLGHAAARRLGVSSFVSLGDRIDVSTNDLLETWEEDERTAAVMLYVETFGNPGHFARVAGRVSRRKPILAVKGRRTAEAARRDAGSHTAAALRGDAVVDALFHQAGVMRFRSGDELFTAAQFFERQPLPLGRRIAILSNSSGVATLGADACTTRGLEDARQVLVEAAAGPERYATALHEVLGDAGIDAAIVYYVDLRGAEPEALLASVERVAGEHEKPVVASIIGADGMVPVGLCVPNFPFPELGPGVLARAAERREWLSRPIGERPRFDDLDAVGGRGVVVQALTEASEDGRWLTRSETGRLLATHGLELAGAFDAAAAEPGADLLVGALGDPDLGPVVAIGLGGPHPVLGETTAFRLLPSTDVEADELIDSSSAVRAQIEEFDGGVPLDREALRDLILRFGALLHQCPELVEVDLNPVRLMTAGYAVLDARVRVQPRRPVARVKTW